MGDVPPLCTQRKADLLLELPGEPVQFEEFVQWRSKFGRSSKCKNIRHRPFESRSSEVGSNYAKQRGRALFLSNPLRDSHMNHTRWLSRFPLTQLGDKLGQNYGDAFLPHK